jgi:hypothetical protein
VVGAAGAFAGLGGFVEWEHGAPRECRDWLGLAYTLPTRCRDLRSHVRYGKAGGKSTVQGS